METTITQRWKATGKQVHFKDFVNNYNMSKMIRSRSADGQPQVMPGPTVDMPEETTSTMLFPKITHEDFSKGHAVLYSSFGIMIGVVAGLLYKKYC